MQAVRWVSVNVQCMSGQGHVARQTHFLDQTSAAGQLKPCAPVPHIIRHLAAPLNGLMFLLVP